MKIKKLIVIGAITLVIGLIVKLPADVALGWALPDTIQTRSIRGTLWHGQIDAISVQGINAGPATWTLKPLSLLVGKIRADVEIELPGGFASADIGIRGKTISLKQARAAFDLGPMTRLSPVGPSQGRAKVELEHATLRDAWPVSAEGQITVNNLRYPPVGTAPLGNYELLFSPDPPVDSPLTAALKSVSGPYALDGLIQFDDNRSYSVRGIISTKPGVDTAYKRGLAILGPANDKGEHALQFDGNL